MGKKDNGYLDTDDLRGIVQIFEDETKSMKDMETQLMLDVNYDVLRERLSQNEKWGLQRHDNGKWLAILVEEVGESAQACQSSLGLTTGKPTDANNLEKELIQVAGVASAWAEQLREERLKKSE